MIQIPVKGYLLYRWIKRPGALVDPGRRIIPYKTTKPGNNHTIVSE